LTVILIVAVEAEVLRLLRVAWRVLALLAEATEQRPVLD
jgi:hypothetical protein